MPAHFVRELIDAALRLRKSEFLIDSLVGREVDNNLPYREYCSDDLEVHNSPFG